MSVTRRECLVGGASLAAIPSALSCSPQVAITSVALGAGLIVTRAVLADGVEGLGMSVLSVVYNVGTNLLADIGANALQPILLKLFGVDPNPVTRQDDISAALKNAGTNSDLAKQIAYLAAASYGEDKVLDAIRSHTPIWLQKTGLPNYNTFTIAVANNTADRCAGGQIHYSIIDKATQTVEVPEEYGTPFCLESGVKVAMDCSFFGSFSSPGVKQIKVLYRPSNVDISLSNEILVVPVCTDDGTTIQQNSVTSGQPYSI